MESLKRLWTQLGKVTRDGALGRRVVEAEQTEGPVRRRIGQMKLELFEGVRSMVYKTMRRKTC